jgi:hypothetical protein
VSEFEWTNAGTKSDTSRAGGPHAQRELDDSDMKGKLTPRDRWPSSVATSSISSSAIGTSKRHSTGTVPREDLRVPNGIGQGSGPTATAPRSSATRGADQLTKGAWPNQPGSEQLARRLRSTPRRFAFKRAGYQMNAWATYNDRLRLCGHYFRLFPGRRPVPAANNSFLNQDGSPLGAGAPENKLDIMWDAREPNLRTQFIDATLFHGQTEVTPDDNSITQGVQFEAGLFTAQTVDDLARDLTGGDGSGADGGPIYLFESNFRRRKKRTTAGRLTKEEGRSSGYRRTCFEWTDGTITSTV